MARSLRGDVARGICDVAEKVEGERTTICRTMPAGTSRVHRSKCGQTLWRPWLVCGLPVGFFTRQGKKSFETRPNCISTARPYNPPYEQSPKGKITTLKYTQPVCLSYTSKNSEKLA